MADFLKIVYKNGKPWTFTGQNIDLLQESTTSPVVAIVTKAPKDIGPTQAQCITESVILDPKELLGFAYQSKGQFQLMIYDNTQASKLFNSLGPRYVVPNNNKRRKAHHIAIL